MSVPSDVAVIFSGNARSPGRLIVAGVAQTCEASSAVPISAAMRPPRVLCGVRKARIELYRVGVALVGGWWHQDT